MTTDLVLPSNGTWTTISTTTTAIIQNTMGVQFATSVASSAITLQIGSTLTLLKLA